MSEFKPRALGSKQTSYSYDSPDAGLLEAFSNPNPGTDYVIGLDCFEFTTLCPITGQPDYGSIRIDYVPGPLCVESKSLKLYLVSYRNHGSFHEACVNQIANHLDSVIAPKYLRVYGDFNSRGGIAIKPMAERYARDSQLGECRGLLAAYDRLRRRNT